MRPLSILLGAAALLFAGPLPRAGASPGPGDVPEKGICRVCEVNGSDHGAEKVEAARDFDGTRYVFCSESCARTFDGFPLAFVPPVLPRPAPPFVLAGLDGTPIRREDHTGRVLLVDFWATWCKPCIRAMPELQKLHDEWRDAGLTVIGVSIDERPADEIAKFLRKRRIDYPVGLDTGDPPAWESYRVAAVPAMFLIDADGRVVDQWTGRIDHEEVARAVAATLEGRPDP